MTTDLTAPIFNNETAARAHLEAIRWPNGPICPHCGTVGKAHRLDGEAHRVGLWQCNERECMHQFSVTVGTVMERSHIPLHKWVLGFHLMNASKKGVSAHQLWRMLGFGSYRTAWFMAHRIREAMRDTNPGPLGSTGKPVEVDETYHGPVKGNLHKRERAKKGWAKKEVVVGLVERGGKARMVHLGKLNANAVRSLMIDAISPKAALMTDESKLYHGMGQWFAGHDTVNHGAEEYVRGDAHTNTIEGYFGIFKRGMVGVYQHCSPKHLQRYLDEFDFRYSNRKALGIEDTERTLRAIKGAEGKRLTYRQPRKHANP